MTNLTRRAALIALGASASASASASVMATGAEATPRMRAFNRCGVAASDAQGARAGADVILMGGNAIDAAVAMGFALAVSYPEAGNLGGGGFMTIVMNGKPYFLDYRETAPAAASENMFLGPDGSVIENRSLVGNQAVGIPGTVEGLAAAHARFGRLPWAQVLAPAIKLARDGFVPVPQMIGIYRESVGYLGADTNLAEHFGALQAGVVFRQPDLAATLETIARAGAAGFYKGDIANKIVSQMGRGPHKGLITLADLERYQVSWRRPLVGRWQDKTVVTAPPPSSGGVALLQLLGMKAARADLFAGVAHNSAQYVHLLAELEKRAYGDRAVYLGDPDFVRVPVSRLISPSYIARRAHEIDPLRPSVLASVRPGLEKPQTTHFSVIDRDGNAVSNTYTLNGWYGSGVVVEDAGFILNNEMDDFSAKPGVANQFGVVGGDANAIAPHKRPLSSMTPSIVMQGKLPVMALGSPGGSRIITSVMQVLLNVYDFNMPLAEAVAKPRYHHQLLPENTIYTEPYAPSDPVVKADLEARGYRFEAQDYNGDIAAVQIIGRDPIVAPDPRARGAGLVV
jgi:gamma-glutamyltranspeptidase / glutathione hydrolase